MADTLGELIRSARQRLDAAPFEAPAREASLLLAHLLDLDEARVLAHPEWLVDPAQVSAFEGLLARRLEGEPIAYLIGQKEFFGRTFLVDQRVLIPRPETEHVVEAVLQRELPEEPSIVDIGTGSGCLAITLALEIPEARVVGADISPAALALARRNARRLGASENVAFVAADLTLGLLLARADLVASNPPYVGEKDRHLLSREIRDFEPESALFAGPEGLDAISRLLEQLRPMRPDSLAVLEIGYDQAGAAAALISDAGFGKVEVLPDYGGRPRVVVGIRQ